MITPPNTLADAACVQQMTNRLSHRGPDADGLWAEKQVALGHRRLSIIDLSAAANQPFFDHSGRYVAVFNGEIYNFQAVKQQLVGYLFRTHSDTEVLLAAYERWGVNCLNRLNGMFAFAIWDRHTCELIAARDRLGKKPFYYYQSGGGLLFASEVRALLASGHVPRRINTDALPSYLMYQTVPEPDTLVAGVRQLPAGHYARFTQHGWTETPYWTLINPERGASASLLDGSTVRAKVRSLLRAAVDRRMVADVPLGAFLSGGIDSAAVVALMAEQTEQPINTFTVTFREAAFDESDKARAMAKRFNTRHTELPLSANQLLGELPAILTQFDQPSGDGINTYVVSKLTKEAGITVALSGLGGDEVFAGYSTFRRYARLRQVGWLWKLPRSVRQQVLQRALGRANQAKVRELAEMTSIRPAQLFPLLRQSTSASVVASLLRQPPAENPFQALFDNHHEALTQLPPMSRLTVSELLTYTIPLLLRDADQMSMAHALELRAPLLDYELVQYLLTVSDEHKMNGLPKQLLVESVQPLLSTDILRQTKQGFTLPWTRWLRNDLRTFCAERIESLGRRGLFMGDKLSAQYERFLMNDPTISWSQIVSLVVLEQWIADNQMDTR